MKFENLTLYNIILVAIIVLPIACGVGMYLTRSNTNNDVISTPDIVSEAKAEKVERIKQLYEVSEVSTVQHYFIRKYENNLAIFTDSKKTDELTLLKITDFKVADLYNRIDIEKLEKIEFDSIEAVENYLEGIFT